MNLRRIMIWLTGIMLTAIWLVFFLHVIALAEHKITDKPEMIVQLPIASLVGVALVGWPLIVNLVLSLFIRNRILGILLLLSAVIYCTLWLVTLTQVYYNDTPVSGLAYLLLPIAISLYVGLPLWLVGGGLEIYFRRFHPGTAASTPSSPAPLGDEGGVK